MDCLHQRNTPRETSELVGQLCHQLMQIPATLKGGQKRQ
jgi:hypothetical protein